MTDTLFKDLAPAASIADDDELLVAKAGADDPSEFRRVPGTAVARPGDATLTALQASIDAIVQPRVATATVDFGATETESARVTVAATWATPTTIIVCSPSGASTPDHSDEDAAVEGITAIATNIVDGVGFDIVAAAPRGTWGRYVINAIGV